MESEKAMDTPYPVDDVLSFARDYAKEILEHESRREDSLISQSNTMQTVFAIMSAAILIVAQIVFEYVDSLSRTYLVLIFSIITAVLLFSLFAATMAQNRKKQINFSTIKEFREQLKVEYTKFVTIGQRADYELKGYEKLYESLEKNNNLRCKWIKISMYSFYATLVLCVVFFIASIIKII